MKIHLAQDQIINWYSQQSPVSRQLLGFLAISRSLDIQQSNLQQLLQILDLQQQRETFYNFQVVSNEGPFYNFQVVSNEEVVKQSVGRLGKFLFYLMRLSYFVILWLLCNNMVVICCNNDSCLWLVKFYLYIEAIIYFHFHSLSFC